MPGILKSRRICDRESEQRLDSDSVTPADQGCSSSKTQAGSANPGTATYPVEIGDWTRVGSKSRRAVFSLTLTTVGLTIKGCMLRRGLDGSYWIAMPALPQLSEGRLRCNQKGKLSYRSVIRFSNKEFYKRFERSVLTELQRLGLIEQYLMA
jgi:hypothetical protein